MHSLLAVVASLPNPFEAVHLPIDASESGWRLDEMINMTTLFVGIIFVIYVVWILWCAFKYGPEHQAVHDHGSEFKSWRWTVLVAAIMFFVVDGDLLVRSLSFMHGVYLDFAGAEAKPGAVRIVVLNDLVVPQGAPVLFQVTSTDVIHSFKIPNMRMMVDAVPGAVTRMWIQPKETGVYEIVCSQHCGANHYKMRGTLTVLPRADYDRWAQVNSVNGARAYDPADLEAHWGWEWAEHARVE
jgi:cytochrome c oxidase subunit 2